LAREYPEVARGWAILSLSSKGIRRELKGEGKGISLPTRDGKGSAKRLAKSIPLFATFSCKEQSRVAEVQNRDSSLSFVL